MCVSISAICSSPVANNYCGVASFWNGVCDLGCETEKYLFDGFECIDQLGACDAAYDGLCASRFANGICDSQCNTPECAWDGGDCITKPLKLADDTLVIFLATTGWRQTSSGAVDLKELGRSLSKLLRTIVRVFPDNWEGEHMKVTPKGSSKHNSDLLSEDLRHSDSTPHHNGVGAQRLFLQIDNTLCKKQCFRKAERAVQYVATALQNKWNPGIPISTVGGKNKILCTPDNTKRKPNDCVVCGDIPHEVGAQQCHTVSCS